MMGETARQEAGAASMGVASPEKGARVEDAAVAPEATAATGGAPPVVKEEAAAEGTAGREGR